jgi:hypothetical protein
VLAAARHQLRRLEPYREIFDEADSIRIGYQLVAQARQVAMVIGDCNDAWDLLGRAAELERATLVAEAEA